MTETPTTIQPWTPKCLPCTSEFQQAENDRRENITHDGELPTMVWDDVEDAITLAPSWVPMEITTPMGKQTVYGVVSVPTCIKHMETKEKTPAQRATESGLILGS